MIYLGSAFSLEGQWKPRVNIMPSSDCQETSRQALHDRLSPNSPAPDPPSGVRLARAETRVTSGGERHTRPDGPEDPEITSDSDSSTGTGKGIFT